MKASSAARQLAQLLRTATPRRIRRGMARIGDYATADIRETVAFPSIELALRTLRDLGFEPRVCVDIGAYEGTWTRMCRSIFPNAEVLMLEPLESKAFGLEKVAREFAPAVRYRRALLTARDGDEVTFYAMETGSSVFPETSPYSRAEVSTTTCTLDTILAEQDMRQVDLIKVDVQGAELEVLRGGTRALEGAAAVLVEVSLVPVNAGCPSFAEVVSFLTQSGFQLFDFCSQVRRRDGVLWQTDLLFVRSGSPFVPRPELTRENWG